MGCESGSKVEDGIQIVTSAEEFLKSDLIFPHGRNTRSVRQLKHFLSFATSSLTFGVKIIATLYHFDYLSFNPCCRKTKRRTEPTAVPAPVPDLGKS